VEEEATNSSYGLVVATSMASLSRKPPRAFQLIISMSNLLIGKSFIEDEEEEVRIYWMNLRTGENALI
jgi:hypothetical protein